MMLGLLLFGVTGAVTSFVASDQAGSLAVVLRVLYLFSLWLLLGRLVIAEQRHLVTAVMCWSLSVCLSGFAALQSVPSLSTVSSHRAVGLTTNVTILGASAAIALAPALAVLMATRGARPRVVIGLSVVGIMLALALSVSLNGLISAAAGCSVLLLLLPGRLRIAIGLGLPIVMAGIVFLPVVVGGEVATAFDRFAASTASPDDQNATFWLRVNIDQAAIDGITESPLVGRGFDQAGAITSTGSQVHNMLLMVWYEGGLGPIFGLCMLFVGIAMEAVAAFRRLQPGTSKTIVAGLLGSGLAALVFSMGNPMLFERYAAMGVMLAIGAGALATTPGLQARAAFGGAPDPEPE
jgi:O-antigen ligase